MLFSFNDLTFDQIMINLAIGVIAGFLAKLLVNNRGGLIISIIIGIIGSFVGNFVFNQFEIEGLGVIGEIAASFVGGCIFAWVANNFSN